MAGRNSIPLPVRAIRYKLSHMGNAILLLTFVLFAAACSAPSPAAGSPQQGLAGAGPSVASSGAEAAPTPNARQPQTVREFFEELPQKYFLLEGCDAAADKECKRARAEYLKNFTEIEDVRNGYFKGGCDGGQSCIEMAIFKRPDGSYVLGIATFAEMINEFKFLSYDGGAWNDISADLVPEYSTKNWYELPRFGTTMKVFEKRVVEKGEDFEATERGKMLYQLAWKDGKFTKL